MMNIDVDHVAPSPSTARRWLMALVVGVLASVPGGCKPRTNAYAPPPPPEVTVAHPIVRSVTQYLENTGTTEPFESVELRARVAGFLEEVKFKPGSLVKKGDLLFVIDRRTYEAAANEARADLAAREAALKLSDITLARLAEAAKLSAASAQEIDQAQAQRDQAKSEMERARAVLATAELNLEFTQVRSPIDGRITKNLVDVGNLVGAAGQATVLATIVNSSPLYVSVDTSEADVLRVRRARMARQPGAEPGQIAPGEWRIVEAATGDSTEFTIRGHIDYVDPALDPRTGTIRVRCRFENEDGVLLPGLFLRVRVLLDSSDQVLAPDIALLSDQRGRYALVVNDKDTVELRRVKIGTLDHGMRVVLEGLSTTDRIIVNGLQRARPGIVVKPTLETPPSPPPSTAPAPTPAAPAPAKPAP